MPSRMPLLLFFGLMVSLFLSPGSAGAHFGAVIPSDDIVSQGDSRTLQLRIQFLHPLEGQFLELAKPVRFGVMLQDGRLVDLTGGLRTSQSSEPEPRTFWLADFQVRRPGDHTFFLEPTPYWEPAEDKFIVHYTKVCVAALGLEQGWDLPVGLEMEIIPLSRPYGLWTGNLFSGQVLHKGQPLPFAEIEVEYLNASPDNPTPIHAPAEPFVTQVIKADANGVFHYAMPRTGWWGFAALTDADWTLAHDGREKKVELGGVFWVHATDMQ